MMQHFVFGPILNTLNAPQSTDPLSHLCLRDEAYYVPVVDESVVDILMNQFLEAMPDPAATQKPKMAGSFIGGIEREITMFALEAMAQEATGAPQPGSAPEVFPDCAEAPKILSIRLGASRLPLDVPLDPGEQEYFFSGMKDSGREK